MWSEASSDLFYSLLVLSDYCYTLQLVYQIIPPIKCTSVLSIFHSTHWQHCPKVHEDGNVEFDGIDIWVV